MQSQVFKLLLIKKLKKMVKGIIENRRCRQKAWAKRLHKQMASRKSEETMAKSNLKITRQWLKWRTHQQCKKKT